MAEVFCQPTSSGAVDGYASWPITASSSSPINVTVTSCAETYTGSPVRLCRPDGTWGDVVNPCTRTAAWLRVRGGPGRARTSVSDCSARVSLGLVRAGSVDSGGVQRAPARRQRRVAHGDGWHDGAGCLHRRQRMAGHCHANMLCCRRVGSDYGAMPAHCAAMPGGRGLQFEHQLAGDDGQQHGHRELRRWAQPAGGRLATASVSSGRLVEPDRRQRLRILYGGPCAQRAGWAATERARGLCSGRISPLMPPRGRPHTLRGFLPSLHSVGRPGPQPRDERYHHGRDGVHDHAQVDGQPHRLLFPAALHRR